MTEPRFFILNNTADGATEGQSEEQPSPSMPPSANPVPAQPVAVSAGSVPIATPTPQPSGVISPGMPEAVDAESFIRNAGAAQHEWLLDAILPLTGVAIVVGAPFAGKSVFMTLLAAYGDQDRMLAGRAIRGSNFLYVKLEHLDSDFARTMTMAKRGAGRQAFDNLHILKNVDLDDEDSLQHLALTADHVDAHVIVIDSLRRASRFEENSSEQAAEIMRRLQGLTKDGQRLVIVLHHLAKGANTPTPRGSGDLMAGVDTFISMTKNDETVSIQAVHHGSGEVRFDLQVHFDADSIAVRVVDTPSRSGASASLEQIKTIILRVCAAAQFTTTQLRVAVRQELRGISNEAVDSARSELERAGRLVNRGSDHRHRWVTAQPSLPAGDGTSTAASH